MIYLDQIASYNIAKSVCYPRLVNRLDRGHAFIYPNTNEQEFLKGINVFMENNSNFRIRFPKAMWVPATVKLYYNNTQRKFMNKNYNDDVKERKALGFTKVNKIPEMLGDFNTYMDVSSIIESTTKVEYTTTHSVKFWMNILDRRGIIDKKFYLIFTPNNMKCKLMNISSVTTRNGLNAKNMYMNFLYNMRYHFEDMKKLLVDNDIDIILTDYRWTFIVKNKDLSDLKSFTTDFFNVAKLLKTGIEIVEDDSLKSVEEFIDSSEEVQIDDRDSVDIREDELIKVSEKIESKLDAIDKNGATSDINDVVKSSNHEDKKTREEMQLELAIKMAEMLKSSVPKVSHVNKERLGKVQRRYAEITKKNLSEITAQLEKDEKELVERKKMTGKSDKMNTVGVYGFDEQYEKYHAKKARVGVGENFTNATVPLYMSKYKERQDITSKDTKAKIINYTFQSPNNTTESHSFTIRVPELRDGKFLHINGSDKVMVRQKMSLPIIKLNDQVLFTSYFGKMFIKRTNGNLTRRSGKVKRFIKAIRKRYKLSDLKDIYTFVPAYYEASKNNIFGPEMLELSRYISEIRIDSKNYMNLNGTSSIGGAPRDFKIGEIDGNDYFATINDEVVDKNGASYSLDEFITNLLSHTNDKTRKDWEDISSKKDNSVLSHTDIVILAKSTPLVLVVLNAYKDSLLELLKELKKNYNLEYTITAKNGDKKPKRLYSNDDGTQLEFSDFVVDIKYNNVPNRMLLNPLEDYDFTNYHNLIVDGLLDKDYDSRHIMNIENYRDFFIDTVATKKVLEDMGIPTNYPETLLYANSLLTINDRTIPITSLKNERMPSNSEIIHGVLYKEASKAYIDYSNKTKRGSKTASFSMERDIVLKELLTLPNVEESSKLNPAQHIDKLYTISGKGVNGVNEDRAYTLARRKWDESFYGIMSDVSPYTKSTGVSMHLAMNPNINNINGYFDSKTAATIENESETMAISEVLAPLAQKHDSSNRTAMLMSQTNHITGTDHSVPPLVTYGMEENVVNMDTDFAHQAREDCIILEKNERFIKVQYPSLLNDEGIPEVEVFNLSNIERNSAKAKYILNDMVLNKSINTKVGAKLKKGTIIAYNKIFYENDGTGDISFKAGPMAFVALTNSQMSHEDATVISATLAKKLSSNTVKRIAVKISPYNKIVEYAKFGPITPGEYIIRYSEDTGSDFYNQKIDASKLEDYLLKNRKCNYNGNLRDIYIYTHLTKEEMNNMDPSIANLIKDVEKYYNTHYNTKSFENGLPNYEKNRVVEHVTHFTGSRKAKINGDSIQKGQILLEFYVETEQMFTIGDKLTAGSSALKGVCSKILPDNLAPYTEKTHRRIDMILSTYSPAARMVMSCFYVSLLNACVMNINNHIRKEILKMDEKKYFDL